jgi:hypothetical protein
LHARSSNQIGLVNGTSSTNASVPPAFGQIVIAQTTTIVIELLFKIVGRGNNPHILQVHQADFSNASVPPAFGQIFLTYTKAELLSEKV